jgi:hypothetical protein
MRYLFRLRRQRYFIWSDVVFFAFLAAKKTTSDQIIIYSGAAAITMLKSYKNELSPGQKVYFDNLKLLSLSAVSGRQYALFTKT